MIILFCFTHNVLKAGKKYNLDGHDYNDTNSNLTFSTKYLEIEKAHVNKIV